jgi:heme-degrading monooxygenase HmoA
MSLDDVVDVVRGSAVPALRDQEGYGGMYLLLADEGKALAISLWTTAEAAEAGTVDSHQKKIDSAIDELERKADGLYAKF